MTQWDVNLQTVIWHIHLPVHSSAHESSPCPSHTDLSSVLFTQPCILLTTHPSIPYPHTLTLPTYLCIQLFIHSPHSPIHVTTHPSIHSPTYFYRLIHLPIHLSIYPFATYPSTDLFVLYPATYIAFTHSIHISI